MNKKKENDKKMKSDSKREEVKETNKRNIGKYNLK